MEVLLRMSPIFNIKIVTRILEPEIPGVFSFHSPSRNLEPCVSLC